MVAQVVEVLVVLIVGQTDGIGTHFLDQCAVFLMVCLGDGPALILAVLVTGNAPQRHILAVEPEAGVCIHMEGAVAVSNSNCIRNRTVFDDGSGGSIAVGISHTVPQMGLLHIDDDVGMGLGGHGTGANHIAFGILQLHGQGGAFRIHGEQVQAGLAGAVGGDEHRVGAVLQQVKVGRRHFHKIHIPVQSAVEGKVSGLGIDIGNCVGNHHGQHIILRLHGRSQVIAEGGESALMGAQFSAVAVDRCHMVGALELDVLLGSLGGVGQVDFIGADAAPVVVAAVLAVEGIPGVGQAYRCKGLMGLGKAGSGQKCLGSHVYSTPFSFPGLNIPQMQYNTLPKHRQ